MPPFVVGAVAGAIGAYLYKQRASLPTMWAPGTAYPGKWARLFHLPGTKNPLAAGQAAWGNQVGHFYHNPHPRTGIDPGAILPEPRQGYDPGSMPAHGLDFTTYG